MEFKGLTIRRGMTCNAEKRPASGTERNRRRGRGIQMLSADNSGFVRIGEILPDVIQEIRYYTSYNFIGERIDGYEAPVAMMTRETADALAKASREAIRRGYRLKIFDAYRPQKAVDHFVRWAKDTADIRMKAYFYPEIEKNRIIPEGYIAEKSGHSRGSTVDLTLFDMAAGQEADMGGPFDYFGELSHLDFDGISAGQRRNRMLLRKIMTENGFRPLAEEWWHFTLAGEPYPEIYFTFPVR